MSLIPAYLFGRPFVPEIGNWDSAILGNYSVGDPSFTYGWPWGVGFVAPGGLPHKLSRLDIDLASCFGSGYWVFTLCADDGNSPGAGVADVDGGYQVVSNGTFVSTFTPPVTLIPEAKYWFTGNFVSGAAGMLNYVASQPQFLSGRFASGGGHSVGDLSDGLNMSGHDFRFRAFFT